MFPDKLLIDGQLVQGLGQPFDVINPAMGEALGCCRGATPGQLDTAIAAANHAWLEWRESSWLERHKLLENLADAICARQATFARTIVLEQGKTLAEAQFEVSLSIQFIRAWATQSLPDEILEDSNVRFAKLQHRPLGVVAAIVPWNYPLILMVAKIAPALLMGNAVIVKPAPSTPFTSLLLAEAIADFIPAGLVNIVADQNDLGEVLTSHPGIAKVSFTGSTATGRKVMASAASSLKRLTLELGGNDPAIVLDDADVDVAARGVFTFAMLNAGQLCLAIKRVYVVESLYERFCDALAQLASDAVVGDGLDPASTIGPVQNRVQFERVQGFMADGRKHGRIISGGTLQKSPGFYIAPTIVRDISDGARLVDEEQFGPVLPVIKVADARDAINRANASPYGLGASVWTRDKERGESVADEIFAGTVWINKHFDVVQTLPLSGHRQSGLGSEFGIAGLRDLSQIKVVNAGPRC